MAHICIGEPGQLCFRQWLVACSAPSHYLKQCFDLLLIDQFHKSQNAPVPYPTMQHSEQKCAHFCSGCCIVGYGTGAFWDLWMRSIGPLETNFSKIQIKIQNFSFMKMHLKKLSANWRPFCPGEDESAILVCSTSLMASFIRSIGVLSKYFYQGLWLADPNTDVIGLSINRRGIA